MENETVLKSVAHAKGQWTYHIEWAPKYRYNMFRKETSKQDMENILKKIAVEKGITIIELAVMPDHVHVIAEIPPQLSLSQATQFLKGKSSYEFFRMHPNVRLRYPKGHFWSKGKFYRTIGDVDLNTTKNYVRNQVDIHQTTLTRFAN